MKVSFKTGLAVKLLVEISRKASDYLETKVEDKAKAFTKIITIFIFYCVFPIHQED